MRLTRRTGLAAALALLLAVPALAAPPYLTAAQLDIVPLLPPATIAGTAADLAAQQAVLAAQHAATPERVALAAHDAAEDIYTMFGATLGPDFTAARLPGADVFFQRLVDSEDAVVDPAKNVFARVRPFLANPQIQPLVTPSKSGSYPSGHATRVTLAAIMLARMLPERRDAIWARAGEYQQSRVIGGMHYPDDLQAGSRVGTAMAAVLLQDAGFRTDFAAARAELRAALGLTP